MRRFLGAAIAIARVTFVIIFSVRYLQNRTRVQLNAVSEGTQIAEPQRNVKDLVSQAISLNMFNLGGNAAALCQEFWRQTVQSRLSTWLNEVHMMGWKRPDECIQYEPPILSRLARAVQVVCVKRGSDETAEQNACNSALLNYRLKLIDSLTTAQRNYLDMPISILVAKILSDLLAQDEAERTALPDFWARIDALQAREPEWFPAQKITVVSLYYRQKAEEDADLKVQLSERLSAQLNKATAMDGRDPQILEIELLRQVDQGEEGAQEIEKFAMKYPDFALGQYHWAAILCRENNRPECLSTLEKTVSLKPRDSRFSTTLQKVRATEIVTDPTFFTLVPDFDILSW